MPPNTVKVARPGRWGNPFRVGGYFLVGDPDPSRTPFRMAYCESYKADPKFTLIADNAMAVQFFSRLMATGFCQQRLPELRGKNLACWCAIGEPCHADVLLELANK